MQCAAVVMLAACEVSGLAHAPRIVPWTFLVLMPVCGLGALALAQVGAVKARAENRRAAADRTGEFVPGTDGGLSPDAVLGHLQQRARPGWPLRRRTHRKTVLLLPVVPLIIGAVMTGTGVAAISQGQAMAAQLRHHGAVATAYISLFDTRQVQTRGGTATIPEWSAAWRLPGGQQMALVPLTTFDGTYSTPPPGKLSGSYYVTVRYDPGNVNVFLPASVVERPSYPRMTKQIIVGSALCVMAMAMMITRWSRRRLAWSAARVPTGELTARVR
jgi:hypothetical protein